MIIEGLARIIEDDDLDEDQWNELDTLFQATCGLETMTRWIFAPEGKGTHAAG